MYFVEYAVVEKRIRDKKAWRHRHVMAENKLAHCMANWPFQINLFTLKRIIRNFCPVPYRLGICV